MKRRFILPIAVFALFIVFVSDASACKCPRQDARARFESAENIFLGKVLSAGPDGNGLVAEIEVLDSWKGVETKRITITTPTTDSASCGVNFTVGEKKLLWINGASARSCDSAVENADEFLRGKPKLELSGPNTSDEKAGNQDQQHTTDDVVTNPSADKNETWFSSSNFIVFIIVFIVIDTLCIGLFLILRSRRSK